VDGHVDNEQAAPRCDIENLRRLAGGVACVAAMLGGRANLVTCPGFLYQPKLEILAKA
jgi:cyclic lactone autoinducer peptide